MRITDVCIEALSCVLPPRVVTSDAVEETLAPVYDRLRLPYGRLELMTGIRERRFWEVGTRPSTVAALAGKKALAAATIPAEKIGCLVHAAVCRDFMEPATAAVVHEKLGLPQTCAIFDVSNACLGVLNGMIVVAGMIQSGQIEAGLVVSGEVAEPLYQATTKQILTDKKMTRASFKKHFASLTIGSGAAAVLLVHADLSQTGHALVGGAVRTNSQANTLCQEDTSAEPSKDGPLMTTDAEALLHAGVALAAKTWDALKEELAWTNESVSHVFTHQVGIAHQRLLFEALAINPAKDFATVDKLGNTGSAALPTAFALGSEEKNMQAGERIALLGIGSGLSSLMLGIEWNGTRV